MLPSARRAELSRLADFDNSYLSRKAFSGAPSKARRDGGACSSRISAGRQSYSKPMESVNSHTTAGVTALVEFDQEEDYARMRKAPPRSDTGSRGVLSGYISSRTYSRGESSHFYDDSDFSDDDSLRSLKSDESVGTATNKCMSIRYADSTAGEIWSILNNLDGIVLHVKANGCQCRRLQARLAALKKPMIAVHKGRQKADEAVLSTIKDLVNEAQCFMERFLDPDWWRKGAGRKEDAETFRELTFRLGFLMQAPAGFQEQSQQEDHADRLKDYADLQVSLEGKLRATNDPRTASEITHMLRRISMREAADGVGGAAEIDSEALRFDDELGVSFVSGGFGTVSMALYEGTSVAVKRFNDQHLKVEHLENFRREVEIFHRLQYDFVVKVLGACTLPPNICIVQEHARWSLFDMLHVPAGAGSAAADIDPAEKAAMLYDIARGLQFLHVKKIVHGSVKSTNVMVFENNRLKVCDFGLVSLREASAGVGPKCSAPAAAWTAPEVLDDQMPSVLSDIYSFGIIIHEVLTRRIPFAGKSVAKVITAVVAKCHRPGFLDGEEKEFPIGLIKLMETCWTQELSARPKGLSGVVSELGHIVNALGGDPRTSSDEQSPGECTPQSPKSGSRAPQYGNLSAEAKRIAALEHELRQLKAQARKAATLAAGSGSAPSVSDGGGGGGGDCGGFNGSSASHPGSTGGGLYRERALETTGFPEERHALRTLFTTTQGPGWKELAGWETNDADLTRWYGIVCGEGGHVISIQLPSNNLQGQIPSELSSLSRLRKLILSDNRLEGPIPEEIGQLRRLTELDLSMNDLTGAIPSKLSKAISLERVYMQCNALVGIIPRSLLTLNDLKIFVVDWFALADTYPFRKFRKASPPFTERETLRAMSEVRKEALERATKALRLKELREKQQRKEEKEKIKQERLLRTPRRSRSICRGSTSAPSSREHCQRSSRRKSVAGGRNSSSMRTESEVLTNGDDEEHLSELTEAVGGALLGASYVAPTAPYKGEDGFEGQARANAAANKPLPKDKFRKAIRFWRKTFKEVIGGDLHPGFSVDIERLKQDVEEMKKRQAEKEAMREAHG